MRLIKMLGLAAVAALAVMAFVGAASASAAEPEYVLKSGEFPVGFTSTSGAGVLEDTAGNKVECESDTNTGELLNSKEDKVTITFKGCSTEVFGFKVSCTSSGESAGTIVVGPLKSYLVYAVGGGSVLDLLYPSSEEFPPAEPPNGGLISKFRCGGLFGQNVEVRGSVLGKFEKTNEFSHTNSLILTQSSGVQGFTEYETEGSKVRTAYLESKLGSGEWTQAGEETTDTLTLEGTREVEVKG